MKPRQLILLFAIAAVTAVLLFSLSQNLSMYTDFATAHREPGREVHVVGQWVRRGEASYSPAADQFSFYLQDSLGKVQRVDYFDPKPANFDHADRVVVIGHAGTSDSTFVADKILMKCPSKYQNNTLPAYEQPAADGQPREVRS